ncbi:MAG: endonuclease domain-containing protein [Alphaproteobacteria bacterium]|nr:endonuclease domain-containing protein [Alphaproteobacteria bacterium]
MQFARIMRRTMTAAEYNLWVKCLRFMPVRFRRQHPFGAYILDFYCPKAKLVIEIDGDSHNIPEIMVSDQVRTNFLVRHGLKMMRFSNQEISENLEGVDLTIREYLNSLNK